ncbi:MAG: hypothetical protein IPP44_14045 [Ideonella sp.]|nr:hypothetical protein [Ideonella sp.]
MTTATTKAKADQNSRFSQVVRSTVGRDFGFPGIVVSADGLKATASIDGPPVREARSQGHSITAEWKIDAATTLKYVWAKRDMDWKDSLDLDGSPVSFAHTQRLSTYGQQSRTAARGLGRRGPNFVGGLFTFKDDGFTNNPQSYFGGGFPTIRPGFRPGRLRLWPGRREAQEPSRSLAACATPKSTRPWIAFWPRAVS